MRRWVYMGVIAAVLLHGAARLRLELDLDRRHGAGEDPAHEPGDQPYACRPGHAGTGRRRHRDRAHEPVQPRELKDKPIGHTEYVCTFTTSFARSCTVTIFMPRGRLIVGGSIRYQDLYELAVLGGTRLYDDARGTLTVIRTTRRPRRHIMLPACR